jgi:hypothetical protein
MKVKKTRPLFNYDSFITFSISMQEILNITPRLNKKNGDFKYLLQSSSAKEQKLDIKNLI